MKAGGMERLTCYVTKEVKAGLKTYGLRLSLRRGGLSEAFKSCLKLAFADPDSPFDRFEGEEDQSCSLDASPEISQQLDTYQIHHQEQERRRAFKRALLHGYSLYLKTLPDNGSPSGHGR